MGGYQNKVCGWVVFNQQHWEESLFQGDVDWINWTSQELNKLAQALYREMRMSNNNSDVVWTTPVAVIRPCQEIDCTTSSHE